MPDLDLHLRPVARTPRHGAPAARPPCPPHDWRCPVIMKLDPDHVAWTCARCGAMALSDDLALRPAA
jgi:hypothetical protein